MAGKPGMTSDLPTTLPAKFRTAFPWALDKRCKATREIAADLWELWTDLGGIDALSAQERALVERAIYLRRRLLEHETSVMRGQEPLMTPGEHSNSVNVLLGLMKTLGLQRRARDVPSLRDYIAAKAKESEA